MKTFIRVVLGIGLGSAPGLLMVASGATNQGLGIALIGGLMGLGIALYRILYYTTTSAALGRSLYFFARWTLARNLGGAEEVLPDLDEAIQPRGKLEPANDELLARRMEIGSKAGMTVLAIPAILLAIYMADGPTTEPWVLNWLKRGFIAFAITMLGGLLYGGAVGAMTVPGIHRRNLTVGTVVGMLIGCGLWLAIRSWTRGNEREFFVFCTGLMGTFGLACGLIAGENFSTVKKTPVPDWNDNQIDCGLDDYVADKLDDKELDRSHVQEREREECPDVAAIEMRYRAAERQPAAAVARFGPGFLTVLSIVGSVLLLILPVILSNMKTNSDEKARQQKVQDDFDRMFPQGAVLEVRNGVPYLEPKQHVVEQKTE